MTSPQTRVSCLSTCLIAIVLNFLIIPSPGRAEKSSGLTNYSDNLRLPAESKQRLEALLDHSEFNPNVLEMIRFSEEAIYLADSLKNRALQIKALIINAMGWKKWGDPATALEKLVKAFALAQKYKDHRALSEIFMHMGETHRAAMHLEEALKFLHQALPLAEQFKDSLLVARIHDRLAAVWFEKLYELPEMSTDQILQRFHDPAQREALFKNPMVKKINDSLLTHLNLSTRMAYQLRNADLIISGRIIRAAYLNSIGYFQEAVEIYQHLYDSLSQASDYPHFELILINYGKLLKMMNDYPRALKFLEKARDLAIRNNNLIYSRMAYQALAEIYRDSGNYEKATEALYLYAAKLDDMYRAYTHLKEFQSLQNFKAAQLEQKLKNQHFILGASTIFFFTVLIILTIFLWLLSKQVRKQKVLLAELHRKNEELVKNDLEKDKFFSIIAHDLKTPFNAIMGFSDLLLDEIREKGYTDLFEYARIVKESAENAYSLLVNLLEWSRARTGQLKFLPEKIDLSALISQVGKLYHSQASRKNISILSNIPDNLTLDADPVMLHAVFRNLLSNCIKFTHPGGKVEITAEQHNGTIEIIISDNGIGMDDEQLGCIFDLSKAHSRPGTLNESGTGLGLILTREFIEKHG